MSTNSTSTNKPSRGSSMGAGLGNTVRGAFQTIEGISDSIRGNAMDFVDSAVGSNPGHPETDSGRKQTEQGVANMEAGRHGAPGHTAIGTQPSVTSSAAPPLPARTMNASHERNEGVVGNNGMGGQPRSNV